MPFNVLATAQARQGPIGQCRLVWSSATQLKLIPLNGNVIKIGGQIYQIPAAGITLSNVGFAANTLYYIYLYNNNGTLTLTGNQSGHVTSQVVGNVGTEVMTGAANDGYTLVGMVYANSSGQFDSSSSRRMVRSWFNDLGVQFFNVTSSPVSTPNTGWTELDSALRIQVLGWAGEQFDAEFTCMCSNSLAGNTTYLSPWVDGGAFGLYGFMHAAANGYYSTVTLPAGSIFGVDGFRTFSLAGQAGGGTALYSNRIISGTTLGR